MTRRDFEKIWYHYDQVRKGQGLVLRTQIEMYVE